MYLHGMAMANQRNIALWILSQTSNHQFGFAVVQLFLSINYWPFAQQDCLVLVSLEESFRPLWPGSPLKLPFMAIYNCNNSIRYFSPLLSPSRSFVRLINIVVIIIVVGFTVNEHHQPHQHHPPHHNRRPENTKLRIWLHYCNMEIYMVFLILLCFSFEHLFVCFNATGILINKFACFYKL